MLKEFKEFAFKGNVIDMAVGVIIGGAFGKIVSSLVSDVITPILGLLTSGIDIKNLMYVLSYAPDGSVASSINYGMFIQNIIDFLIIAFSIFMFVKLINSTKKRFEKKEEVVEAAEEPKPTTEDLLAEIRDLLKNKE